MFIYRFSGVEGKLLFFGHLLASSNSLILNIFDPTKKLLQKNYFPFRMCHGRYGADLINFKELIEELDPTLLFMQYESNQALCFLKQVCFYF